MSQKEVVLRHIFVDSGYKTAEGERCCGALFYRDGRRYLCDRVENDSLHRRGNVASFNAAGSVAR